MKTGYWMFIEGVLLVALALVGCPREAANIRDSIAALDGFLRQAQDHHEGECVAQPSKALCQAINRAGAVQNAAGDFVKIYCEGPREPFVATFKDGGPCIEQKGMEPRARAVLQELQRTIADLKAIVGDK